ncbi:uncharacterized protein E0L32_010583 [Thyridium curvatum]|uniref:Glutamate carboxypeptidase n=1 Tax=Thyridium curvatum TaxID=1093900 RepID=A0A507AKX1_9PEZI|nr:uncharacterized protein E0L32_010583 [Thyridium curvatum]TPX07687.1 hypothetical protein E0L32_010583 [Thyridium curvatum]
MAVSQDEVERVMLRTPEVHKLRHWSQLYSAEPHLAGDLAHAERIRDLWRSYGIPTELATYEVLQNFPESQALQLLSADGKVAFEATLREDEVPEDPTSSPDKGLPAFHGFGANGDVCAELVYANFGTIADFDLLAAKGISVKGKIVICKYAKVFRGLKIRAAEQYGAAAVILYNDPQEDGEYTTRNGYQHFPDGPARHPKTIQRGSVDYFSVAVGDPTTPGYPSLPGRDVKRCDPTHAIPTIPSLPISYSEAQPFLEALNGHGLSPSEMGGEWLGQLEGVQYCTGPSALKVSLSNQGTFKYATIYNVVGTIQGTIEECVVLGNHHDSWCCGAIDPVSGTTSMNEVARGFGDLLSKGWRPLRKIILCNWDNEEYGLVGSTEWGEDNAEMLSESSIAYINVDESTNGGRILGANGSPLLNTILRDAAKVVESPLYEGKSVYDDWLSDQQLADPGLAEPSLALMGTGSDYTVFFDHLGIPSIDMLFNRQGQGVYPYHSNYDSYYWVDKFGDPGFKKHLAMARLWGLVVARLAEAAVVPFTAAHYPATLKMHLKELKERKSCSLDFTSIDASISRFQTAAEKLDQKAKALSTATTDEEQASLSSINTKYRLIERLFLLPKGAGLPGRPWYRHMVFAPGLWYGYDGVIFPGVLEALEKGELATANEWLGKIATAINSIADMIEQPASN